MSKQSLDEQVKNEIQRLDSSIQDLQSSVRLTDIRDRVEDLDTTVNGLHRRVQSLRERGYAFEKEMEIMATDFQKEWSEIEPGIKTQIEKEGNLLQRSIIPLETKVSQLISSRSAPAALKPRVDKLINEVENLENQVKAAENSIRGTYDGFSGEINKMEFHLNKLEWTLTELGEATFSLLATESVIMAVKAVWAKESKQEKTDPEGVFFLTDQRILFEQKEKVTTKKVLFVPTEKELVHELHWDIPLALIDSVKSRKEGFLNKDNYLDLTFESRSPFDFLHLRVWQAGDEWITLINKAKAGDYDQTRAIPIDEKVLERVKNAPTKCPSCGGAINQVILRGMESLSCEYCGDVIRI